MCFVLDQYQIEIVWSAQCLFKVLWLTFLHWNQFLRARGSVTNCKLFSSYWRVFELAKDLWNCKTNDMNLLLEDAPYAVKKVVSIFLICLLLLSVLELFIKLYHPETVAHRCSAKKRVAKNFSKFLGNHLCRNLFFLITLQVRDL